MGDPVRLLRRNSTAVDDVLGVGYTSNPGAALIAEPEAVSADFQQALTSRARRAAQEQQRREWREHRAEIERRIDWLYSQRLERRVESQLRVLRRQLDRLDRLIG